MDAVLKMFAGKKQSKASLQLNRYSLQKSSESSRGPKQDVDSTEARRKAAVWAWYQRGGDTVSPTRNIVERKAVASRDRIVDRPKSRFKAEATSESSSYDSSAKSTRECETILFDASELSGIAERVQLLVQKLKVDVSSENPSRGGDTVSPTRNIVERKAVASRDGIVDRPKSRFKDEATSESSSYDSSSKSTRECETILLDASELSGIAERVQLLVQKLKGEVSSENPSRQLAGNADIALNEHTFPSSTSNPSSSTSEQSEPPTAQSHQQTFEKGAVIDHRLSSSDLSGPRQFHQQTPGKVETHSSGVHSRARAETDYSCGIRNIAEAVPTKQRKLSFRRPFSVVQRLFQGTSRRSSNPCSEVNAQAQTLHHYHHHHHVYYHHISDEEVLQPPEITSKARPPRRNSENFTAYTEGGSPDHETRRVQRHSIDVGAAYRVDYTGDAATEARDYFYGSGADEGLVQSQVHPSMQEGIKRASLACGWG